MCGECRSSVQGPSKDLNASPFDGLQYSSEGDKGVAMKQSTKFDGPGSTDQKFDLASPDKGVSAKDAQYAGRQ